jgi:hypothetical protein
MLLNILESLIFSTAKNTVHSFTILAKNASIFVHIWNKNYL